MGNNPTGEQPEKLFALQGNDVASPLPFLLVYFTLTSALF
jgi:hypothetical protein